MRFQHLADVLVNLIGAVPFEPGRFDPVGNSVADRSGAGTTSGSGAVLALEQDEDEQEHEHRCKGGKDEAHRCRVYRAPRGDRPGCAKFDG